MRTDVDLFDAKEGDAVTVGAAQWRVEGDFLIRRKVMIHEERESVSGLKARKREAAELLQIAKDLSNG